MVVLLFLLVVVDFFFWVRVKKLKRGVGANCGEGAAPAAAVKEEEEGEDGCVVVVVGGRRDEEGQFGLVVGGGSGAGRVSVSVCCVVYTFSSIGLLDATVPYLTQRERREGGSVGICTSGGAMWAQRSRRCSHGFAGLELEKQIKLQY